MLYFGRRVLIKDQLNNSPRFLCVQYLLFKHPCSSKNTQNYTVDKNVPPCADKHNLLNSDRSYKPLSTDGKSIYTRRLLFSAAVTSSINRLPRPLVNPQSAKLNHLNFHPLEVVPRYRDPQLQVGENYSYNLFHLRPKHLQSWCLNTYFFLDFFD